MGIRQSQNIKVVRGNSGGNVVSQAPTIVPGLLSLQNAAAAFVPESPGWKIHSEEKRIPAETVIPAANTRSNRFLARELLEPLKNNRILETELGEIKWRKHKWKLSYNESPIESPTFELRCLDNNFLIWNLSYTTEFEYQETEAEPDVCWKLKKYVDDYDDAQTTQAYFDGFPDSVEIEELLSKIKTSVGKVTATTV